MASLFISALFLSAALAAPPKLCDKEDQTELKYGDWYFAAADHSGYFYLDTGNNTDVTIVVYAQNKIESHSIYADDRECAATTDSAFKELSGGGISNMLVIESDTPFLVNELSIQVGGNDYDFAIGVCNSTKACDLPSTCKDDCDNSGEYCQFEGTPSCDCDPLHEKDTESGDCVTKSIGDAVEALGTDMIVIIVIAAVVYLCCVFGTLYFCFCRGD